MSGLNGSNLKVRLGSVATGTAAGDEGRATGATCDCVGGTGGVSGGGLLEMDDEITSGLASSSHLSEFI